jgi:hypothetical protein
MAKEYKNMSTPQYGRAFAGEALLHASRDTLSSHANGLAAGVGSSSEPLGGFTDFAGCGFATSAAQIFIRPFLAGLLAHLLAVR